MIRLSLAYFYSMGSVLRPVQNLAAGMKLTEVWGPLYQAQSELHGLLSNDWFAPAVKNAAGIGVDLHTALKSITDRSDFEGGEITHIEAHNVTSSLKEFETVLKAELSGSDTFFVTRKGGFDTGVLVQNAEQHFPLSLTKKVPEAVGDLRAAGRCLAFELGTASGFHSFRAVEAVLRKYWDAVTKGAPHPDLKTIGEYIKELDKLAAGDVHAKAALKQLAKLHRNPLIHPGDVLDVDEAIAVFNMCHSCITTMLPAISDSQPAGALESLSSAAGTKA